MIKFKIIIFMLFINISVYADTVNVVVSIRPAEMLVRAITSGVTEPQLLLPSKVSPHDYNLRPSDYRKLHDANLIVWFGPELEGFLMGVLDDFKKDKQIVEIMQIPRLKLLEYNDDHNHHNDHHSSNNHRVDPHIWLSPGNAKIIGQYIAETLIEFDEKNADQYKANLNRFLKQVGELECQLHNEFTQQRNKQKLNDFIVTHDAYQYFETDFGLQKSAVVYKNHEMTPSAKYIISLRDLISKKNIQCIFAEPQLSERVIDQIIGGSQLQKVWLDPIGVDIPKTRDSYIIFLGQLAESIKGCIFTK